MRRRLRRALSFLAVLCFCRNVGVFCVRLSQQYWRQQTQDHWVGTRPNPWDTSHWNKCQLAYKVNWKKMKEKEPLSAGLAFSEHQLCHGLAWFDKRSITSEPGRMCVPIRIACYSAYYFLPLVSPSKKLRVCVTRPKKPNAVAGYQPTKCTRLWPCYVLWREL